MPLIKLQVSVELSEPKRQELLKAISALLVEAIGKPEKYVMASIEEGSILMSGQGGPAALAEVRSIGGLNSEVNNSITSKLCSLLQSSLGIAPDRVYLNFSDVPRGDWGWNNRTFG